jgi:hypothetical protein
MRRSFILLALLTSSVAAQERAAVTEAKAREIGCAAIQRKYPEGNYKCADLGVTQEKGNWQVFQKLEPGKLGGGPSVTISKAGKVTSIGYFAM